MSEPIERGMWRLTPHSHSSGWFLGAYLFDANTGEYYWDVEAIWPVTTADLRDLIDAATAALGRAECAAEREG